jgi:hypothetical protein
MSDTLVSCPVCGLIIHDGEDEHVDARQCIAGLRAAMLEQRKAAEELGLTISSRFLAVLEELSIEPEVEDAVRQNLGFTVRGPDGKIYNVPPQRMTGVFSAIRHLFERAGDFSPLAAARRERDQALVRLQDETKRADWERDRANHYGHWVGALHRMLINMADKYKFSEEDRMFLKELKYEMPGQRDEEVHEEIG